MSVKPDWDRAIPADPVAAANRLIGILAVESSKPGVSGEVQDLYHALITRCQDFKKLIQLLNPSE